MKTKKIALWGIMGALAIAISFIEGLFEIPFLPGAKIGLSNVITIAAAMTGGVWGMLYITLLKAIFALFTRGFTAFLLSCAGGILAGFATVLLLKLKKQPFSLIGISIIGALLHNAGQLAAAMLCTKTLALGCYAPVLMVAALVTGSITGIILKVLLPYLKFFKEKS